ncbi:MAG: MarR family winged helix-turn-helix transcriptional regulator [Candidatus Dormibacteria bacterium]
MTAERIATPWESPGFLLWHATLRWQRATAAALRPFGITHVQFVLLASTWWLGESGDAPSQHQLAEHCGTDPMMTSQVARTLEAKGLLTRASDPADSRVRRMSVTSAGREMAPRAIAAVEAADRAYFAPVADQPSLRQLLNTLAVPSASSRPQKARTARLPRTVESRR